MQGRTPFEKPNVLWICTDQQRYDTIAALGNPHIRTPNLDRLCAEGTAFTRTYCQSPICTPSRASFLTGLYPSVTHVNRNGNSHYPLEGPKLITRCLADVGYTCGLAGKLHIASAWNGVEKRTDDGYSVFQYSHAPNQHAGPNRQGWPLPPVGESCGNAYIDWLREKGVNPDELFEIDPSGRWGAYRGNADPELRQTAWCGSQAVRFIREQQHRGPWLMSVNPLDPHPPFDGPDALVQRYDSETLPESLFRETDVAWQDRLRASGVYFQSIGNRPNRASRQMKASYYATIELIDREVGRMLEALDKTGQRDRTVVIFTSDHGDMLGDHGLLMKGCRFYDGLVRVPLIVSWPGRFRQGVTHSDLVELSDIAPTLAELAGTRMKRQSGRSLLGYLATRGEPPAPRDFVRCEYLHTLNMDAAPQSEDKYRSFGTMFFDGRWKLVAYHGHGLGELFDMDNDPGEFTNLWEDPTSATIKANLIQRSFDSLVTASDLGPDRIGRY